MLKTRYYLILFILMLFACTPKPTIHAPHANNIVRNAFWGATSGVTVGTAGGFGGPAGLVIGGLAGTLIGYDIQRYEPRFVTLQKKLDHWGVQRFRIGEDQKLVVPVDQLFYPGAPRVKRTAYELLDLIAEYLQYYRKVSINVAAYTDNTEPLERSYALSRQQAQNVVDYLWKKPLDTRMMFALGFGRTKFIAPNKTDYGRMLNRRVEISFRMLPLNTT